MTRRIHVPELRVGEIELDTAQAHHARDVLRLASGTTVEAFDDAGAVAQARLVHDANGRCMVVVDRIDARAVDTQSPWGIAAAIPKGPRADWMVEKLSELGAGWFIPLHTGRSVVLAEGKNKRERWDRIATEAAKQSRRVGVMRIEALTTLDKAVAMALARPPGETIGPPSASIPLPSRAWVLSTEDLGAVSMDPLWREGALSPPTTLFVGPEGGWTVEELRLFASAGVCSLRLGSSVLRIETAAIAAGAVLSCRGR